MNLRKNKIVLTEKESQLKFENDMNNILKERNERINK